MSVSCLEHLQYRSLFHNLVSILVLHTSLSYWCFWRIRSHHNSTSTHHSSKSICHSYSEANQHGLFLRSVLVRFYAFLHLFSAQAILLHAESEEEVCGRRCCQEIEVILANTMAQRFLRFPKTKTLFKKQQVMNKFLKVILRGNGHRLMELK